MGTGVYSLLKLNESGDYEAVGSYPTIARLKKAWLKEKAKSTSVPLQARVHYGGNYSVINDQMPEDSGPVLREFSSAEERDAHIIANAEYFTVVRFLGVGRYERNQTSSYEEALKLAQELSDKNQAGYLVYAVDDKNLTAYVTSIKHPKARK